METSLHRQLKLLCSGPDARVEVRFGSYRIDVVNGDELIEIQHGSLAAIRDKTRRLLESHRVRIIKPIVRAKHLVKLTERGGASVYRRTSPKRGRVLDIFDELVYFTRTFPHPRLTLDCVLVEIEETRFPGHGRRRRWRRDDYQTEDQRLLAVGDIYRLRTTDDLIALLPALPPAPFHTGDLAQAINEPRWRAARIAYCLRKMNALKTIGKCGNALLYSHAAKAA